MEKPTYKICTRCSINYTTEEFCDLCKREINPSKNKRDVTSNRITKEEFYMGRNSVMSSIAKQLQTAIETEFTEFGVYYIGQYVAYTKNEKVFANIEVNNDSVRINLPSFKPDSVCQSRIQVETRISTTEKAFSVFSANDIPEAMKVIKVAYNMK